MLPALAAAGVANIAGPLIGSFLQSGQLNKGMRQYRAEVGKGTDVLTAGKGATDAAFQPWQTAGATAAGGQLDAIQNRQMAPQPTATNTSASGIASWLNPMAQWQQNQATKAGTAAGIATGATGGGMQRALANNASKMAAGSWNDAYKQMLDANAQNFGQGQQLYENKTGFDQAQITNLGDLAKTGLSAVGTNQGLQQNYNADINANYGNIGAQALSAAAKKGQIFQDAASGAGSNVGGLIGQLWK